MQVWRFNTEGDKLSDDGSFCFVHVKINKYKNFHCQEWNSFKNQGLLFKESDCMLFTVSNN